MLIDVRYPGICHVADIALLARHKVSGVFADGYISIVARRAGTEYLGMVDD
jgi:hypothetical protein